MIDPKELAMDDLDTEPPPKCGTFLGRQNFPSEFGRIFTDWWIDEMCMFLGHQLLKSHVCQHDTAIDMIR